MVEFQAGLRGAAKPLVPAVQDAARRQLPKSGGLNEQVAGQRVSVRTRMTARTADVRLVTTAPDTAQTDAGFVRHPIFGRRTRWVHQSIPEAAGWWSNTLRDSGPAVTAALVRVMDDVAAKIGRV